MTLSGANALTGIPGGMVDGHAHVFERGLALVPGRRYAPTDDALLSEYVAHLKQHRMVGGVLVQPSFLGTDNSYLLAALKAVRQQSSDLVLKGVVTLAPSTSLTMLDELTRRGVVGMRFNLFGKGPSYQFDITPWIRLLKDVSARGWHVALHGEGALVAGVLPQLLRHAETVVVDHFGLPDQVARADAASQAVILSAPLGRVFVKVSAPYRVFRELTSHDAATACDDIFTSLFETLGPEHLLWGSDWPWTQFEGRHSYADTVSWGERWVRAALDRTEFPAPKIDHLRPNVFGTGVRR